MNIAIIPARVGSKRIPRKNIRAFAGMPIIGYSIKAAQDCGLFDHVIVSTDSEEVAEVAGQFGAEIPFVRPSELSDDHTPIAPVLMHCLVWLASRGIKAQYACCILATAPFVQTEYIRRGYEMITNEKASSAFAVTSFPFPIQRALKIKADGSLAMFWPEHELTRSNDLPEAYHDAGQFYWLDVSVFMREGRVYNHDARPVFIPRWLVQDIDTPEDWETAEIMFEAFQRGGGFSKSSPGGR